MATVTYLIVAGGGSGGTPNVGAGNGGGGGAGGYLTGSATVSVASYTMTVGGGGATHTQGTNSSAFSVTSIGGGYGSSPNLGQENGGNGGSGGGGGTGFLDFPIPDVGNVGGILICQNVSSNYGGISFDYTSGTAFFFGSSTSDLIYGGTVMLNDKTLDTMSYGGYLTYGGNANVTYDGSSPANFSVSGAGSVPAFNASITAPTKTTITAPVMNATISRASNLDITWDGTGADSLIIVVAGNSGGNITKTGVVNDGSLTISSSELSGIAAGSGIITVVKYKFVIHTEGTKNYTVIAQTYQYVAVTFN